MLDNGQVFPALGVAAGHDILQPTGFLLLPDGKIMMESYSSGPLGRFTGSDVARVVAHVKSMAKG